MCHLRVDSLALDCPLHTLPPLLPTAPVLPPSRLRCSDQLARQKDRLRIDIGHLSHPVYGAPELATALVDNPAEYLPIVRVGGWVHGWLEFVAAQAGLH